MSRKESKSAAASIAASLIVVTLVIALLGGVYVGGYFWLGEWKSVVSPFSSDHYGLHLFVISRRFPHPILATIYKPASAVESWWRGEPIVVRSR
jgi:hypothetical protein